MSETPKEMFDKLLAGMAQNEASDLHLKVGCPPCYRMRGVLRQAKMPPIPDSEFIFSMLHVYIPEAHRHDYLDQADLDFAMTGETGDRYRVNLYRSAGMAHVSIRRVQCVIPTFEQLHLPPIYRQTVERCIDGLILVSGATGVGKSSTLAALVDHINEVRSMHIITIEDPIEFLFQPKKSIVAQREIGIDVPDYEEALRYVVRQDPDCILIGEMRDRDTMTAAIQAAETGHLVLGSLHVSDVQQTFNRILEFFPQSEHPFVRGSLSNSLRAVFCQRLLPGIDEVTRYPATEVLLNNTVVKDKIARGLDEDLPGIINRSREEGMHSFTQSLCDLVEVEKIHYDTARDYAPNREALASAVKGIKAV